MNLLLLLAYYSYSVSVKYNNIIFIIIFFYSSALVYVKIFFYYYDLASAFITFLQL